MAQRTECVQCKSNTTSGICSSAIGYSNSATGDYSFAGGQLSGANGKASPLTPICLYRTLVVSEPNHAEVQSVSSTNNKPKTHTPILKKPTLASANFIKP
jgi:hypothetical protein